MATTQTIERGSGRRRSGPPLFIWLPAAAVALLMLVPPFYLAVRAAEAGTGVFDLLFNMRTLGILVRTGLLMALVTGVCVALGVSLAWLTVRTDMPLRRTFAVLTTLPLVVPSYVFALITVVAIGPRGMVQGWLEPLGVERLPSIYGLSGSVLILSLLSFPYVLLPVRAALYRADPAMEEAARSLGKSAWETFFRVTFPLLRPATIAGALLVALYTLSDFGAVAMMRYQTFTWSIYIQYESALNRTLAASLSLVLVAITLGLVVWESMTRGRAAYHRVTPGTVRTAYAVRLGRWRWPAVAFAAFVVFVSLVGPMAVLVHWALRGLLAGEPLTLVWAAAWDTVRVSLLAALATVIAGIPVAVLSVRYPSKLTSAIERLTFVGFALPGIPVALAFVFFSLAVARPVYQTTFLLVLAYVVLFLPAAVGAVQASLRQVSPRIEEAARGLGHMPLDVFRSITLPLLARGIMAGAALVFLLTMKELPATLVLSPLGFRSLATFIWGAASEALFARAAMASLLLVLTASVPMAFIIARERR